MDDNSFTVHHLRFTVEVEKTIVLGAFKGSALRGAWQGHLRTLYCAQVENADPLHQAMCPVCFLLSRETGSGDDRRPYSFEPPLTPQTTFEPGERFSFGISLFGQAVQHLCYILLSVGQMGQSQGLGRRIHNGRRGTFHLLRIEETNSFGGQRRVLLEKGDAAALQTPAMPVTAGQVAAESERLAARLRANGSLLTIHFLTPTRIIQDKRLVHQPRFSPLFARLVDRVAALRCQFADGRLPPREEKHALLSLSDGVALVTDETRWWDVQGRSGRLRRSQPLGGYVGRAVYRCDDWEPLLPWLLWGQSTHVGKNAAKGTGWYEIERGEN
jgi:hypothetical protein